MKKTVLVLLLLSLPFFAGCFGVSSYFNNLKCDIMQNVNGDFEKDVEFSVGPIGLSIVELFVDMGDDLEAEEIIDAISAVQVSVYKRHSAGDNSSNYATLKMIDRRMTRHGWKYIVKSCKKDEVTAVYIVRNPREEINKLFVVSLNRQELVLAQLDGDLNKVFETAIKDRGFNYN